MTMMVSPTTPFFLDFQDKNGKRASVKYYLDGLVVDPEATEPAALTAATVALSNLVLLTAEVAPFAAESAAISANTGPFDRVQDKAKLNFQCGDGSKVVVELPAPIVGDFDAANSYNIAATGTDLEDTIAYIMANCCSAEGIPITRYLGGNRMRPAGQKNH